MMFLRCNRTSEGTLTSYFPPMPMCFEVRPTSSTCLLENNPGGRAGCFGMTSSCCGPSRKSHNAKAPEKLSVPCKILVILSNESIHLFKRASQGTLRKFRKTTRSQKQRRGWFSSSKPRFAVQSGILWPTHFSHGWELGRLSFTSDPSFEFRIAGVPSKRSRALMGMHLALCDARDIIDEMKHRVGNRWHFT